MSPAAARKWRAWSLAIGRRGMLGVTAGNVSRHASNARGVTAGKMGRNSSTINGMKYLSVASHI